MRRFTVTLLALVVLAQPACFLKFWGKGPPPEEKVHDVYGTVESVSATKLAVQTKQGSRDFIFGPASRKGGDFREGDYVHVYYKRKEEGDVITLVVEKLR